MGAISVEKGDSRSKGDDFLLLAPLGREPAFPEELSRSRTADGVVHRMSENVTFERRERRPPHPRGRPFSGRLSSRSQAKIAGVSTVTPSNESLVVAVHMAWRGLWAFAAD